MNRLLSHLDLTWMIVAQAIHLLSLLTWLTMMDFIREAFSIPGAPKLTWPVLATGVALLYPALIAVGSVAAWFYYRKRETNQALVLISLPLFLSLPMTAYGFVVRMALR